VLVSAVRLIDPSGGGSGNFYLALHLCAALAQRDDIDLTVLTDEGSHGAIAGVVPERMILRASLKGNVLRRDLAVASAVYRLRPDIYHKPTGALPTVPLPCRTIACIGDLNFASLPTRLDKRLYKEATHRWTSRMADHIVCISEFTRRQVLSHLGADPARVSVIHLGSNELTGEDDGAARQFEGGGRFWVAFGHHPHKNVETLLHLVAAARRRQAEPIRLVVIGEGAYVSGSLMPLASGLGVADAVHFAGRVSTGALRGLYRRSEGLLFPSRFEGFGLPVLEAMANDCPVICSDICALPEIAGDAALRTAPTDVAAMLDAVQRLRGPLRAEMIRRGRVRAAQFSWEKASAQTVALYHATMGHADVYQTAGQKKVLAP
jgi:glycosyltransferase involved in cell wall biosynthesis